MRPIFKLERARALRADWAPGPGALVLLPPVARSFTCKAVMPNACNSVTETHYCHAELNRGCSDDLMARLLPQNHPISDSDAAEHTAVVSLYAAAIHSLARIAASPGHQSLQLGTHGHPVAQHKKVMRV
jgi:hypothetical protein